MRFNAPKTHSSASRPSASAPFSSKNAEDALFSMPKEPKQPFFGSAPIQPKLTVGRPGDKYEREVDVMADNVVEGKVSPQLLEHELPYAEQQRSVPKIQLEVTTPPSAAPPRGTVRCLDEITATERTNFEAVLTQLRGSLPLITAAIRSSSSAGFRFGDRSLNPRERRRVRTHLIRLRQLVRELIQFIGNEEERICFGDPRAACNDRRAGACFRRQENDIVMGENILRGLSSDWVISETVILLHEYVHLRQEEALRTRIQRERFSREAADAIFQREVESWTFEALLFEILVPRGTSSGSHLDPLSSRASRFLMIESSTLDAAVRAVIDPSSTEAEQFQREIRRKYPDGPEFRLILAEIDAQRNILLGNRRENIGTFDPSRAIVPQIRTAIAHSSIYRMASEDILLQVFVMRSGDIVETFVQRIAGLPGNAPP